MAASAPLVEIGSTQITFNLPDSFGLGWDYEVSRLYPANHAYAGSYCGAESHNHAHEALWRLTQYDSAYLHAGLCCTVTMIVENAADLETKKAKLEEIVRSFPVRRQRVENHRGSNFLDTEVRICDPDDLDAEPIETLSYEELRKRLPYGDIY